MKITVSELRLLINAIYEKLHQLNEERENVAYVEYEKGEQPDLPRRTFEQVSEELQQVKMHLRIAKEELANANLKKIVEWNNEMISVNYALELVKQMREEARRLSAYGSRKKVERRSTGVIDTYTLYVGTTFIPEEVKQKGEEILRQANRLSIVIDKANFANEVSIPFHSIYQ